MVQELQTNTNLGKPTIIGEMPAGNITTSAAILYAGTLPSKVLQVFPILNCYTITKKTFRHQTKFLQPAIHLVWTRKQNSMITKFKDEKRSLVLAGNGRADSPGHSAKYGSYSLLELTYNKVIDFKLVQVRTKLIRVVFMSVLGHTDKFTLLMYDTCM